MLLDCDSTLIEDEVIELLAEGAGKREEVAQQTLVAMRGALDFTESLKNRVACLQGIRTDIFAATLEKIRVSPGARELIAAVHEKGGKVGVVSGGFHEVLDGLAKKLGIDFWRANRLEIVASTLTGRTLGPVVDAAAKKNALLEWAAATKTPLEKTMAIGDGANDIEMVRTAAIGVAYNAKPILNEAADVTLQNSLAGAIPLLDRLR